VEGVGLGAPLTTRDVGRSNALAGATGILGGTFDPPHLGHLGIAEDVRETLDLAGVLFVPAGLPPHKADRAVTAAAHRARMVELAIAGNEAFASSRVELDREGPSYSADTVDLLRAEATERGEDDRFVLIVSAEALTALPTWHDPERLLRSCHVAVVDRPGFQTPGQAWVAEHFPRHADRIVFVGGVRLCHSSSDIRARVASGRSIRYLVAPAVAEYIKEHDLYVTQTPESA
jgi:nicotinate-nucleotide adenylyltransferase